jgi:hypothetical protein
MAILVDQTYTNRILFTDTITAVGSSSGSGARNVFQENDRGHHPFG